MIKYHEKDTKDIAFVGISEKDKKSWEVMYYNVTKQDRVQGYCILPNGRRVDFTQTSFTEYDTPTNPTPPPTTNPQ